MTWLRNIAVGLRGALRPMAVQSNSLQSLMEPSDIKGFREFTVPPRFRGGAHLAMARQVARDRSRGGIIPLSGGKVP